MSARGGIARGAAAAAMIAALLVAWCAASAAPATRAKPARRPAFEVGADLSSLAAVESHGGAFHDGARTADAMGLLRARGFTSVRLRLWHTPARGESGLDSTLRLAARAHAAGLRILLDLHYADTWADPGHQPTPTAWLGLTSESLADSVHAYTRAVVGALAAQGTPPDAVQIGNEIDGGLLWDAGRVGGDYERPQQWRHLAALLAAGSRGVREAAPAARVVVHVAAGGDAARCRAFFEHLEQSRLDYDVIAVSYYPWWHGPLDALRANLAALAGRFGKDVIVAETAYPWTLRWFDNAHNLVGTPAQLLPGYGATPEGQAAFARAVREAVAAVPEHRGAGVWWWEPTWIAAPGSGSPWENCALFDSTGALLPPVSGG